MKLINSSVEILNNVNGAEALKAIEVAARTCYKSEDLITDESAKVMVAGLIKRGHEAMLEFYDITVKFTCDRGVSHELVRHRVASYAQESTRYCNYSREKFGNELTFIKPTWYFLDQIKAVFEVINKSDLFEESCKNAESSYLALIERGCTAQEARQVLPNSLKTEICMKCSLREWRHFFSLRCDTPAHPDMRKLALDLLKQMHKTVPVVFDDLYNKFIKQ